MGLAVRMTMLERMQKRMLIFKVQGVNRRKNEEMILIVGATYKLKICRSARKLYVISIIIY